MNLGMKLRNIHTGIEAEIVGKTILASAVVRGSRLRKTVYVLEYGDTHLTGKRHFRENWNDFYMHNWECMREQNGIED